MSLRTILVLLIVVLLSGSMSFSAFAENDYTKISIEFDSKKLDVEAYLVDGRTLVPLRAIFEKLNAEVKLEQETQSVTATKGSTIIKLRINDVTAQVNTTSVTLDVPPMLINSSTFVPLRFVSESLGAQVAYDSVQLVATIQTNSSPSTNPSTTPTEQTVEPFVVKGRVTDKQGQPLEDVEIIAENQLIRSSYQKTFTDADGYYQIDLPQINTTWKMISYYERKLEGKVIPFNLTSVTDRPFGANKGAVRDFVWDDISGKVIINIWDYPENENWPKFSLDEVELTLTPVSRLIDGSEGKTIKGMSVFSIDGAGLQTVPIAKYEITARWMPTGMDPIPMVVSDYSSDKYAKSIITANFETTFETDKRVAIKVAFPKS